MKLTKINIKKRKLLKLYILKYQIYLSNLNKFDNKINFTLENIEIYLKKYLKLIYEYHSKNEQILFVGFSFPNNKLIFDIKNTTKHKFISKNNWFNGLLSNNNLNHKKKLPKLIVIFNSTYKTNIIKEAINSKIPVISFGDLSKNYFKKSIYIIPGNYKKLISSNIFSLLLFSILKVKQKNKNFLLPKILTKKNFNKKKLLFQQSKYTNTKKRYNDYKKI